MAIETVSRDRWEMVLAHLRQRSDEYLQRFRAVCVLQLENDNRPAYITLELTELMLDAIDHVLMERANGTGRA